MINAIRKFFITSTFEKASIRIKIFLTITITTLASLIMLGTITYINFRNQLRADIRQRLVNMVSIAALQQDGDLHATIQNPSDEETDAYKQIKSVNAAIIATDPDIQYIYTMRSNDQGQINFVVDTGRPGDEDTAAVGEFYIDISEWDTFDTFDQPYAEEDFYTDRWGTFQSAYAPFYTKDGHREGIIGIDINASKVLAHERSVLLLIIELTTAAFILVTILGLFFGNTLSRPIVNLSSTAQSIINGDLYAQARIETKDEVGSLAGTFNAMTSQLRDLIENLEQRIEERTNELQGRTTQLETIASLARSVAAIQDLDSLLPAITQAVSKDFGVYHAGIFLIDAAREFAVLRAANSEGGQKMLAREHKLKVGEQGIVGNVALGGNPRIALDVGDDAVFFNNPDLPGTHSEVALPLRFGQEIIGVLDVQSTEINAFSKDDMEIFTVLADQLSVAIQNARSLEQAKRAVNEAEFATSQLTGTTWKSYTDKIQIKGYRYDGLRPEPIKSKAASKKEKNAVQIPVELRGQTIGRLKLMSQDASRKLTEDELAIIQSTADRVALAIDSARLLDEAQKRAARETVLSEISSKLSSSSQLDNILRDTVEELGLTLKGSTVTFQLVNPQNVVKDEADDGAPQPE